MTASEPPDSRAGKGRGSPPKLHHVVPRFYLRRFAVNDQIELVKRDDFGWSRLIGVPAALAEKHFYSLDTDEGREPLGEELLAQVDKAGAEAIRRVFDEGRALHADGPRATISLFLAFQFVRGRRVRDAAVEQYRAQAQILAAIATPEMVKEGALARGEQMSDEEAADIAAYANSGDFKIEIERQGNLHMMAFSHVHEMVKFFHARTWRVLEYTEPVLLTSDEPVALIGPDPHKLGAAGGLANAPQIVFPVDSRRALLMLRPDIRSEEGRFPGTAEQAEIINRNVAYVAHRYIVCTPGAKPLAGMVLPKKPPATIVVKTDDGYIQGTTTNASEEDQARIVHRIEKRYRAPGATARVRRGKPQVT